jgi:putative endonuclease
MFYGYILQSKKTSRYYAGYSEDLERRLQEHNSGESKSTKSGMPWELVHSRQFETRSAAMQWEKEVKSRGIARYLQKLRSKEVS